MSNASSVFSADASILSSQSSSSNGKLVAQVSEEECGRVSPSSIDQQLEMISQTIGEAKSSAMASVSPKPSSSLGLPKYFDEDSASLGGSTDNLGVWDDISSGPDSDENEGKCVHVFVMFVVCACFRTVLLVWLGICIICNFSVYPGTYVYVAVT